VLLLTKIDNNEIHLLILRQNGWCYILQPFVRCVGSSLFSRISLKYSLKFVEVAGRQRVFPRCKYSREVMYTSLKHPMHAVVSDRYLLVRAVPLSPGVGRNTLLPVGQTITQFQRQRQRDDRACVVSIYGTTRFNVNIPASFRAQHGCRFDYVYHTSYPGYVMNR
jgi:hypothetical protein